MPPMMYKLQMVKLWMFHIVLFLVYTYVHGYDTYIFYATYGMLFEDYGPPYVECCI